MWLREILYERLRVICRPFLRDCLHVWLQERFPNNDGFDPESCTNVTLVNSHISVADDGICPKANDKPLK